MRIMSEGLHGMLSAWSLLDAAAGSAGTPPAPAPWLAACKSYGNFLLSKQDAADGSLLGEWAWDGTPLCNFTNVGVHAVPFLVALAKATSESRYLQGAVRLGEFAAAQTGPSYSYVGGACDNPNVLDKEAGVLTMQAFLSLHNATGDARWIGPAAQAATYCETWTYAWEVPVPSQADDPNAVYPGADTGRTTLGASLIASGQSGADNFMAIAVSSYEALHRLVPGDTHFGAFAAFLAQATKQVIDWDGALGYGHPGLMNEAVNLAVPRGHGVRKWLPWLTVAVLDPMVNNKY
jgi:hypothetical protein